MNQNEAEKLSILMQQISHKLNESVGFLSEIENEEKLKEYRRTVGKLIGMIYTDIERKLWEEFPELLPENMDGDYKFDPAIHEPRFFRWPEEGGT